MAIARGFATTGDVQEINYYRNYLENDLHSAHPDVADIESYIDFTIDDINATLLTAGYTLPVTIAASPYGYRWIQYLNALGAAEMAERRDGSTEIADSLRERYDAMKEGILDHTILLTDIPGVPTQAGVSKSGTSELTAAGDERSPFFTRDAKY